MRGWSSLLCVANEPLPGRVRVTSLFHVLPFFLAQIGDLFGLHTHELSNYLFSRPLRLCALLEFGRRGLPRAKHLKDLLIESFSGYDDGLGKGPSTAVTLHPPCSMSG
jgi:hypothetical protein